MAPNLQESFWKRNGLGEEYRDVCLGAIGEVYPEFQVSNSTRTLIEDNAPAEDYTISASQESLIVQVRPQAHTLDLEIGTAATKIYGSYAPKLRNLECKLPPQLRAVEMNRLHGVPLSRCNIQKFALDGESWDKHVTMIQSFASFIALSWSSSSSSPLVLRKIRADSPLDPDPTPTSHSISLTYCTGTVGVRIVPKLQKLAEMLPDTALRQRATDILLRIQKLDDIPVVLNHGDLIPSNILVDPHTWRITGVVDWAEAEWLPFGTCLYGLELLLGYMDMDTSSPSLPIFRYYDDAPRLRELFWERLGKERPEVRERMKQVRLARDIGVLLWYGFAWDEGRIDRVVNEKDDKVEVECLRKFLEVDTDPLSAV